MFSKLGSIGGALAGTAFGGPVGGAIGGGVGGFLGGQVGNMIGGTSKAALGGAPQIDPNLFQFQHSGQFDPQLGDTAAFMRTLEAQARGEGPSVAQNLLQQGQQQAMQSQLALAASGQGSPLAGRQVAQNVAQLQQAGAGQAAMLGAQEQQQATQQLGDMIRFYESMGMSRDQAQLQANQQMAQMQFLSSQEGTRQRAATLQGLGQAGAWFTDQMGGLGGIKDTIGGLFSDEALKKDIEPAEEEVELFLSTVSPKKYKYVSKEFGPEGDRYGIMAQDLEKSPMGKSLVRNTPKGKMVDTVQGFGALLAATAQLHKKIQKLEGANA